MFGATAPASPSHPAPPGIGFVLHVFALRRPAPPADLARLGLFGALEPACWVGLAPPILHRGCKLALFRTFGPAGACTPRPELASFRTIGMGLECWNSGMVGYLGRRELGSFRTLNPNEARLFLSVPAKLALFRTISIGLEWWNNRTVEWWGIRAAGNWLCLYHRLPPTDSHVGTSDERRGTPMTASRRRRPTQIVNHQS